ncbi:MAG TPA: hypothetical protein VN775_06050 [Opitutaceae bacterium]|nr:hypothetical protein [Opitutaceae bacterium]
MSAPPPPPNQWKFVRVGGLDQVSLKSASDLSALGELDQKLWVALSCPVKGLQVDERTLAIIDTDGDGHVRPPEIIAAVTWACARLKDPSCLQRGGDVLPLEALGDGPEGRAVADAALWVLSRLGKSAESVSAAEAAEVAKVLSGGPLKGDGILRPEAAPDDATRALIMEIAACCGNATEETVAAFYADLEAFRAWSESGGAAGAGLGPAAAEAFAAVAAVRSKVADYFARVQLAAFDSAAIPGLNRHEEDYRAIAGADLSAESPALAGFPLARIEPGRPLPLLEGVNPAWAAALSRLREAAVVPLLGAATTRLTPADWAALAERLRPYEAWIGTRPTSGVARLGLERINAILGGPGRIALAGLFSEDRALAPRVAAAADVERLALFYRDLGTILRNFVNFSDFYSKARPAVFQAGTLYMDSRSCRLCIRVDDVAAHSVFAGMSRVYVAYVECRRPGGETIKVAAGFTQGDSDYLFVGRNGVFYDRSGRDWDATIVKIADSPISIRQSFFAPYKKVASFVGEQFSKFAASKDQAVQGKLTAAAPAASAPLPSPSFDIAKFAGIFAALGLAIGAIGGALASVFSGLLRLAPWQWPLAVAAALLLISGPSMLLAALKLRQRNLGPLLEGTGWAVNGRVKINMPLGAALTDRGVLPPNSDRLAFDPYEDEAANTRRLIAGALAVMALAWLAIAKVFHLWPF